MNSLSTPPEARFVVATPTRSVCDNNARVLEQQGRLRFLALGTRRGTTGVSKEHTRLLPVLGLASYAATRLLSAARAESFRFRLNPWFDRWVYQQLTPGDHILSSYGHTNECFRFVRQNGGKTFLDGGNSHPCQFWKIISEEHQRWGCAHPPVARQHYERSCAMMAHVDYVLCPSHYVAQSFLANGFKPAQLLYLPYPTDISCFRPAEQARPKARPLTIVNTGSLSLRKGTPYLLEAFRMIRQRHPTARLKLIQIIQDDVKPVLAKYSDLPIEWMPPMAHPQLAEYLRNADLFVLPSLEEGLARTTLEALASGLPAIVTPHCGTNDFITPGVNGEVVPTRDSQAIAEAVLKWAEIIMTRTIPPARMIDPEIVSFGTFARNFLQKLNAVV